MKKFLKSFTMICLAILMVCPILFVGCSKTFIITIEVGEGGYVYKKGYEGVLVHGTNAVEEGDKFEYFIKPTTGYEIDSIIIDGAAYAESYDKDGVYLSFDDIKDDHKVVVSFKATLRTVTLYCRNDANTEFIQFGEALVVTQGSDIDFDNYGGQDNAYWYKKENLSGLEVRTYIYNDSYDPTAAVPDSHTANILRVGSADINVYTDLTESQLKLLMGITA